METVKFKVKNSAGNKDLALFHGILEDENERWLFIGVPSGKFPYLGGNVRKIKKAIGF